MTTTVKAADLGHGAVVLRDGRKCIKKYESTHPWSMRQLGMFTNNDVDGWLAEGAQVVACCDQYGIGAHDPIEHGDDSWLR